MHRASSVAGHDLCAEVCVDVPVEPEEGRDTEAAPSPRENYKPRASGRTRQEVMLAFIQIERDRKAAIVLKGADLTGAQYLTQDQINSARGDEKTQLPSRLLSQK